VRLSAWIPAPPPESVPAIVSARTGVSPLGVSGRNFTRDDSTGGAETTFSAAESEPVNIR